MTKGLKYVLFLLLAWGMFFPHQARASYPLTITDVRGKQLVIKSRPQRIISLLPSITEILCSLGLEKQLAGRTAYCDYPPSIKSKPAVGDLFLDYEKIIALNPDLIVAEESLRRADIPRLEKLGYPVLAVSSQDLAGLQQTVRLIAQAADRQKTAELLLGNLNLELEKIAKKTNSRPLSHRPRVLVEIQLNPLISAGSGTYIDELLSLAGGRNMVGKINGEYGEVNPEEVLKTDPEVILLTTASPADLSASPIWRHLSAVENRRVHSIDPNLLVRPTLRVTQTLKQLQGWFYD